MLGRGGVGGGGVYVAQCFLNGGGDEGEGFTIRDADMVERFAAPGILLAMIEGGVADGAGEEPGELIAVVAGQALPAGGFSENGLIGLPGIDGGMFAFKHERVGIVDHALFAQAHVTDKTPTPEEDFARIEGIEQDDAHGGMGPGRTIGRGDAALVEDADDIIIGLAGTASEQAAGMGKPIVSFGGRGVQYTSSFAKRQVQLLGESLSVVKRDPVAVAAEVLNILTDNDRYQRMSKAGFARVSGRGSSKKIASYILCG